jgi:O-antigen ligase
MFKERPFLGWGPGTYFKMYAPFQKPHEKTIISTNAGDVGGVHSEYLGPLVETGVPGFLIFIGLVLTILRRGMRLVLEGKSPFTRSTALYLLLGLITYLSHGFLNNYLDIDKTASLFWASLGGLAALDIFHNQKEEVCTDDGH